MAEEEQDDRELMFWDKALEMNHGDYAYHSSGGMITHEKNGSYTIRSGDLTTAAHGKWKDIERKVKSKNEIPAALQYLEMGINDWMYE